MCCRVKRVVFLLSVALSLLSSESSVAQWHTPYVGANVCVNFTGLVGPGFGAEAGVHYQRFYAGVEWSAYDLGFVQVTNSEMAPVDAPFTPYAMTEEQAYGVHLGYAVSQTVYLGIVALLSRARWLEAENDEVIKQWFNVGPDARIKTSEPSHIYVVGSYTFRRGLKFGLGWEF